ncbi:MAG: serine hydrolase domain-containing protein [Bacteroidales bacterium]
MKTVHSMPSSVAVTLAMILVVSISCKPTSKTTSGFSVGDLKLADQKMQAYVDKGKLPCMSLLVIRDGKTLHQRTFGFANIEEERALKKDAIFRIYSMSKPITAAALMMLYDEGKFQLDDPVAIYIPGFKNTKVWAEGQEVDQSEPFTIRHLLTHTAGFCYGWDAGSHVDSLYNLGYQGGIWAARTLENMMKLLAGYPLKNQPGSKWEYSVSIDVAGYLVEVLSGISLDEFLQTRLFEPLEMDDTGFQVPEKDFGRLAMIYSDDKGSGELSPVSGLTNGVKKRVTLFSGGGGLVSTIGDYGRFGQMLLNGGELNDVRVLKESTVKLIMSDQLPSTATYGEGMGYGLGGQVNKETGEYSWSGMASTYFVADPANNMVILAFTQYIPNSRFPFAAEFRELVREALEK